MSSAAVKTSPRKPHARRPRRAIARTTASSDEDDDHSDSDSTADSDDTASSSEDAPNTPAPPATSTDHSVSPPSKRRSKKPPAAKTEPLIPAQATSWSELVSQEDDLHSSEPPIIDFADFVSGGPSRSGPAPEQEGGNSAPARGRGRPRGGGGKTQRQAYLERLTEDPSFIPRVGGFWGHDERLLAPELRSMSEWWRGRGGRARGRGRGAPGRAPNAPRPEQTEQDPDAAPAPTERTWGHDGFEQMRERDRDRPQPRDAPRGRGRGRGRGGRGGFVSREPEQLWTKAPDTHLHVDPATRPQFHGQGRGIKVNLPGQWRPSIVRVTRNSKPPARAVQKTAVEVPTEIVVKLPGKAARVVSVSDPGPSVPTKPALPEEPETVRPLQDVPPKPIARLPGTGATSSAPRPTAAEFIPRPVPTSALPAQVLQQPAMPAKPVPPVHGRTRSQLGAVAFARPSVTPSVPLSFGSFESPAAAPPPETNNLTPSEFNANAASAPLPPTDPTSLPLNLPVQRPPMPQPMASFTPPPAGAYYNPAHNPYAYTPLDGATYYSTATPPPPPPPGMYYPPNGFFIPPRRGPVSIRAPGESVGVGEERPPPMYYYPQHGHSHSHSHGHNPYYNGSPSGTPYPPPPPPPQPGYYQGAGEYPGVYDYVNGGVYY